MTLRPIRLAAILAALITLTSPALHAQAAPVPQNPTAAAFDASPDHASVARYEYGLFLLGAASPSSVTSLGKQTPDATNAISFIFSTIPLAIGNYELKVRAVYITTAVPPVTINSPWVAGGPAGTIPVPFDRAGLPPANLRLR